jgi:hypothetical protein
MTSATPAQWLGISGGSGGVHAYWRLGQTVPATRVVKVTGELVEPIERANLRIVHRLGVGEDGKPNVADPACAERSRVMRLAGTVNGKTGAHARIVEADLQLAPYPVEELVGDLPDPVAAPGREPAAAARARIRTCGSARPSTSRSSPGSSCRVTDWCPARRPVSWTATRCARWAPAPTRAGCCHAGGCGARGAIYDLASVLLGGQWGHELRGEAFKRARVYVADAFGGLSGDHDGTASGRPGERRSRR